MPYRMSYYKILARFSTFFFLTLYRWKPKYTTSSAKASAKEIPIGIPYRELLFPYREFPIGTLVWLFSQTKISIGNPYRDFPIRTLIWLFLKTKISKGNPYRDFPTTLRIFGGIKYNLFWKGWRIHWKCLDNFFPNILSHFS